jgi:hypothetical protein
MFLQPQSFRKIVTFSNEDITDFFLATKKIRILFCKIAFKHLMLKKFGLQGYDAGSLGERLHCSRGT